MRPSLSIRKSDISIDEDVETDQIIDRIVAMKRQELTYETQDYLFIALEDDASEVSESLSIDKPHDDGHPDKNISTNNRRIIDEDCRVRICDWCYKTVDQYNFKRESVQIAMSYLDRFLSTKQGETYLEDQMMYQLATITCLYIAMKFHESVSLDVTFFTKMSNGYYSKNQIFETEVIILFALQWKMNPPTVAVFVRHILQLLPKSSMPNDLRQKVYESAQYQAEVATLDYTVSVLNRPSAVAMAIVMNALDQTIIEYQMKMNPVHIMISSSLHSQILKNRLLQSLGDIKGFSANIDMDGVSECGQILLRYLNSQDQDNVQQSGADTTSQQNNGLKVSVIKDWYQEQALWMRMMFENIQSNSFFQKKKNILIACDDIKGLEQRRRSCFLI